jgi:hypothetical protein
VPTIAGGKPTEAFISAPLPPLEIAPLLALLGEAQLALGKLDAIAEMLPDVDRFSYTYVRKEALVSSQIEGTQSSPSDLLLHEIQDGPERADQRRRGSLELRRYHPLWHSACAGRRISHYAESVARAPQDALARTARPERTRASSAAPRCGCKTGTAG